MVKADGVVRGQICPYIWVRRCTKDGGPLSASPARRYVTPVVSILGRAIEALERQPWPSDPFLHALALFDHGFHPGSLTIPAQNPSSALLDLATRSGMVEKRRAMRHSDRNLPSRLGTGACGKDQDMGGSGMENPRASRSGLLLAES